MLLTCDSDREEVALIVEVSGVNVDVIHTAVVPLVGVVCGRIQEVGRVIDSWLGVAACCVGSSEGEGEDTSWVLWLDGAGDGEVVTLHHPWPLMLAPRKPVHEGGGEADVWIHGQICNKTEVKM